MIYIMRKSSPLYFFSVNEQIGIGYTFELSFHNSVDLSYFEHKTNTIQFSLFYVLPQVFQNIQTL